MTASLVNNIYAASVIGQPTAEVNMGATVLGYTDRKAATITLVSNKGKFIQIQLDTAKRIDTNGMSEMQEYEYSRNKDGITYNFKQDKTGRWFEVQFNHQTKRWNKIGSHKLIIGKREHYHDFSF